MRRGPGVLAPARMHGFTMTELVVVIVVLSFFVLLAQIHLFGLLRKSTFRAQIQELVSTMQMAASAAAESDRRYEVIIDVAEQTYMLRQITNPELSEVLEEEIVLENVLGGNCRVAYVEFDDGDTPMTAGRSSGRDSQAGRTAEKSFCSTKMRDRIRLSSTG